MGARFRMHRLATASLRFRDHCIARQLQLLARMRDRIFKASGMACHALTYNFVTTARVHARTYRLNWCRTSNGEWRIHS